MVATVNFLEHQHKTSSSMLVFVQHKQILAGLPLNYVDWQANYDLKVKV